MFGYEGFGTTDELDGEDHWTVLWPNFRNLIWNCCSRAAFDPKRTLNVKKVDLGVGEKKIIKVHLGWLVVWGGIFGGVLGAVFNFA